MPHACVKCKQLYPEQSEAILKGCVCGSRIFYFIKSDLPLAKVNLTNRSSNGEASGENEPVNISSELLELSKDKTVIISTDDPENIRVVEQGSYELNVDSLFKGDPVILRTDSEVYYVKLPTPKKKKKPQ
ncbi:MAG: Zn-ribbon containing protein [Candidatus Micrarchaeota archaeon]|nr:Zn-ribbon containing protein [Candidatus Micrarchaeota archaeon]